MSSRLKPSAVWVRSLVPNEKKSASSAIRSACKHARGSSIIVPTDSRVVPSSARDALDQPARELELALVGDERDHHLDALPGHARGRGEQRAHLHLVQLREQDAEAHAARAEHRVGLLQLLDAPALGGALGQRSGWGRNSCSGGSSRRTVTGRPSTPRRICSKSASCSGRSRSIAARARASSSAMITAAISGWRSPRNMCSVRHSPMPSAPSSIALRRVLRRVGVGAHAERAQLVAPPEHRLELLGDLRLDQRHVLERDRAEAAVDRDPLAGAQHAPADPHLAGGHVDLHLARRPSPPAGPSRARPAPRGSPCRPRS